MASNRSAYGVAAFFTSAGLAHFAKPDFFESIMPRWIPSRELVNQVSGAAEIGLGLAMIPRATRPAAAKGLLVLLLAVFPANIDMALNDVDVKPGEDGRLQRFENAESGPRNWFRLPLQFLMMAWVWTHLARDRAGSSQ